MHRAVTGALIGALVGAAVTAAQLALQPPPAIPDAGANGQGAAPGSGGARQVALRAIEGALAGAVVALVVDRRSRTGAAAIAATALERVVDATDDARDRLEPLVGLAVDAARERAVDIAHAAESGARQLVLTFR